jgi:hypothetical protein
LGVELGSVSRLKTRQEEGDEELEEEKEDGDEEVTEDDGEGTDREGKIVDGCVSLFSELINCSMAGGGDLFVGKGNIECLLEEKKSEDDDEYAGRNDVEEGGAKEKGKEENCDVCCFDCCFCGNSSCGIFRERDCGGDEEFSDCLNNDCCDDDDEDDEEEDDDDGRVLLSNGCSTVCDDDGFEPTDFFKDGKKVDGKEDDDEDNGQDDDNDDDGSGDVLEFSSTRGHLQKKLYIRSQSYNDIKSSLNTPS